MESLTISSEPTEYEIQQAIKNSEVLYTSDDFDELFAEYLIDDADDE
ncbi:MULTISPECIES: hypothetical protein [Capnocytophaga]|nr:hypothetical protein [Capnocytophaga canis]